VVATDSIFSHYSTPHIANHSDYASIVHKSLMDFSFTTPAFLILISLIGSLNHQKDWIYVAAIELVVE